MTRIELDWEDMQEIAADCVAPGAAELLDALDGEEREGDGLADVLCAAVAVRDAAEAIIAGYVRG